MMIVISYVGHELRVTFMSLTLDSLEDSWTAHLVDVVRVVEDQLHCLGQHHFVGVLDIEGSQEKLHTCERDGLHC